ncbi:hypothetical protein AAVH_21927 [Aphelenchoides avenae]|nr:hypothetical protein AAVH_21927 [Aphelenchus avenae]
MVATRRQSLSSASTSSATVASSSSSVSVAVTPPLATDPPQLSPHGPLGTAVDAPQGSQHQPPLQLQTQLHRQRIYAAPQTRQQEVVVQVMQPQQQMQRLVTYSADRMHPRELPRQRYIIRHPPQQQQHVVIAPRQSSAVSSDLVPPNVQRFESPQPQTAPLRSASSQLYSPAVDQPVGVGQQYVVVSQQQAQQSQMSQLELRGAGGGQMPVRPVIAGSGLVPRPIVPHRAPASLPTRPNSSLSTSASPTPSSQKMPPAGPTRAPYAAPARGTPNPRPHAISSSSEDSQDSTDSTPFVPPRSSSLHSSSESSLDPPTGFPSFAHSQAKVHKVMRNISAGAVKRTSKTDDSLSEGPDKQEYVRAVGMRATDRQMVLNEKELSRYATEKVDAGLRLDPDTSTALAMLTDDLLDDIIGKAVRVARHRGSKHLEKRDVEFVLRMRAPPVRPKGAASARQ